MKGVQNDKKGKVANKRKIVTMVKINKMTIFNCRKGKRSDPQRDEGDNLLTAKVEELIKQN